MDETMYELLLELRRLTVAHEKAHDCAWCDQRFEKIKKVVNEIALESR